MEGLGIIWGNIEGIMQHNALALNEQGIPQGIMYQKYWSRNGAKDFEGVEGAKWEEGLSAVNKHLAGVDNTVVVVPEREADIFDFLSPSEAPFDPKIRANNRFVASYCPRNSHH